MLKPRTRQQSPGYLSPNPQHPPIRPSSAFENVYGLNTPAHTPISTNLPSAGSSPKSAMGANPPTLDEILQDVSSPPWTLTAFMAYLSQNHCMETLEFTLDAQRYASFYHQHLTQHAASPEATERVCASWEKLMQVYIVPCAPREVNIPARVRDCLLSLDTRPSPPHPSELEEAGRIIYELMNDSLLVPFIESVTPLQLDIPSDDHIRHSHNLASGSKSAGPRVRPVASLNALESESLTDDSDGNSPLPMEPMTPPTTPPTSEWSFTASPGGFHRAVAASNKGWKKVGEKLGFGRKSNNRRPTPTSSSTTESDLTHDSIHGHAHNHSLCGLQAVLASNAPNPDCLNDAHVVSSSEEPLADSGGPHVTAAQRYLTPESDVERQVGGFRGDAAAKMSTIHGANRSTSIQKTRALTRSAKFQLGHRVQLSLDPKFTTKPPHVHLPRVSSPARGTRKLPPIITTPPLSDIFGLSGPSQSQSVMDPSPTLSDLSNYLDTPLQSAKRDASPPMMIPELASPLPVCQDAYGWDAEWDRRFDKVG